MEKQNEAKRIKDFYFDKALSRRYSESTRHYHQSYEIYYMKEGRCRYFIDDRFYEVVSGDVVFIPMGVIHRTNYMGNAHSRILLNFTKEYVPSGLLDEIASLKYHYREPCLTKAIAIALAKIETEYSSPDRYSEEALRCYTGEIIFNLLRNNEKRSEGGITNALVDSAIRYIQQNYMHSVSLSDAAKLCSVSSEHLSRIFKKSTGFGFSEYVTLLRLKRAEYMLKNEPGVSVGEIAYVCGFNDGNYFSYKFKKTYGISPTAMRNQGKISDKFKLKD